MRAFNLIQYFKILKCKILIKLEYFPSNSAPLQISPPSEITKPSPLPQQAKCHEIVSDFRPRSHVLMPHKSPK